MVNQVTGRVAKNPHELYVSKVLKPQFDYELEHYLQHYISIEKVLLQRYEKMDLLGREDIVPILAALNEMKKTELVALSGDNLTDIALTIERYVNEKMDKEIVKWHVDRSRNDYQATAQLMYGREKWLGFLDKMFQINKQILKKCSLYSGCMMPGYTHYQSAQVITIPFYLTAVSEHILHTISKMLHVLESINGRCPLGSGAMSGQELPWNCDEMAASLGFTSYTGHALAGVASRGWVLEMGECLSYLATNLSRFLTDFLMWGSSEQQFITFPDELSGISSSMPQKRNFPLLERARGKTSHLVGFYMDMILGQRNTPYSNLVEVSKESSKSLPLLLNNADDVLDLFLLIVQHMEFNVDKTEAACSTEFFGGFSLANQLTLKNHIPYRTAQVIAGRFITFYIEHDRKPDEVSNEYLTSMCKDEGFMNHISDQELLEIFDFRREIDRKITEGSTHDDSVGKMMESYGKREAALQQTFISIKNRVLSKLDELENWEPNEGSL
ncbi:lyase family protein [Rossellomorea marisflavi]|uniref:lyase family protein n=1 Tax=Rossellomorea marisflavi TaxID=189381 RepID=UPI0009A5ADA1|nr:lyase family protein [Rossellomorea marisflavi]